MCTIRSTTVMAAPSLAALTWLFMKRSPSSMRTEVIPARACQRSWPTTIPASTWSSALDKGSKGDEVVWLQEHLVAFSPTVPVDGVFGTSTQQALMSLQTSSGLPPSGETDPARGTVS